MTNGEYLQSISMERLAQFLDSAALCPPGRYVVGCDRHIRCDGCWVEWLLTEREAGKEGK